MSALQFLTLPPTQHQSFFRNYFVSVKAVRFLTVMSTYTWTQVLAPRSQYRNIKSAIIWTTPAFWDISIFHCISCLESLWCNITALLKLQATFEYELAFESVRFSAFRFNILINNENIKLSFSREKLYKVNTISLTLMTCISIKSLVILWFPESRLVNEAQKRCLCDVMFCRKWAWFVTNVLK